VTLVFPGGETRRATIDYAADYGKASSGAAMAILAIGPGLPDTLPQGRYALVFEAAVNSDVVSFVPLDDGTIGMAPPEPFVACSSVLDTWAAPPVVTVTVTFSGDDCTVKVRP
jgi:hypothetical protein